MFTSVFATLQRLETHEKNVPRDKTLNDSESSVLQLLIAIFRIVIAPVEPIFTVK